VELGGSKAIRRLANHGHRDFFTKFIYSPIPAKEQKFRVVRYNSSPQLLRGKSSLARRGGQGLCLRSARTSHQGIAMSSHL
jgi:hypothetical protein